ncbi:MAG: RQC-minor-1 family DNA-binding protein [Betaproteobacteria bacterium]
MSHKVRRVGYHLEPKGIAQLSREDLRVILRGADDLIGRGGRSLLTKILRGSRAKAVLDLQLDKSPAFGCYRDLPEGDVLARIDRAILDGYMRITYDYRLPVIVYTDAGWAIEKETCATELLHGFDKLLTETQPPYDMSYLKDRGRDLIWCLLDKVDASRNPKYLPLLEAWGQIDYAKVRQRIRQVMQNLGEGTG